MRLRHQTTRKTMKPKKPFSPEKRNRKIPPKRKKRVQLTSQGKNHSPNFLHCDWEDTSLGDLFHFNGILNEKICYILPCNDLLLYKKCPEHSDCVALMWATATNDFDTLFNSLFHFKSPEEWKSFSILIAAGEYDDPDRINVKKISEQFPYYASQRGLLQIAQDVDKMCRIRFGCESDVINYLRGIRQR